MEIRLASTAGDNDVSGRERMVNLFPVRSSGGKYPFKLVSAPGRSIFATLPTFPVLGLLETETRSFAATPSGLYEISATGTVTSRGSWAMSGRVKMAFNGTHLAAVDGNAGWVFNLNTNTLGQITDPDFYPADTVIYYDGYFLFNRSGTGQYFWSDLLSTDLEALSIATAEAEPDNIITGINDHREVFWMGGRTTEVIYNVGTPDNPFQRNNSAYVEKGCAAKYTVAKMNNSVYFVGHDLIVYEMRGYTPVAISTERVHKDLQNIPLDDTYAYAYHENGQLFYVLTIAARQKTWVFEAMTRTWHERSSTGAGQDIGNDSMFFDNKTLVGDYRNGNIYHQSLEYFSDASQPIIRTVTLPTIRSGTKYFSIRSIEFDMARGVGTSTGDGSNPRAWIRISKDQGKTWHTHPDIISIGQIGEYSTRVRWKKLGRAREFDIELNISDPVKVEIGGAFINE